MVVFSIGAQILDTLLIKSVGLAADVAFSVASWGVRSLISGIHTPSLTTEQRLSLEVSELKDEIEKLKLENAAKIIEHNGEEYLFI